MPEDRFSANSLAAMRDPGRLVSDRTRSDLIAEAADLPNLDARAFFGQMRVTEGTGLQRIGLSAGDRPIRGRGYQRTRDEHL
jgi:hypothetical protein